MKIFDTFLFCFAILLMLIGIHQAMMFGFPASYWIFMLALGSLLWFQVRKKNQKAAEDGKTPSKSSKPKAVPAKKKKK